MERRARPSQPRGARGRRRGSGCREPLCFGGLPWAIGDVQWISIIQPASRVVGGLIVAAIGFYFLRRRSTSTSKFPSRPQGKHDHSWAFGFTITALNPTLAVTWTAAVAALHSALPVAFAFLGCPDLRGGGWSRDRLVVLVDARNWCADSKPSWARPRSIISSKGWGAPSSWSGPSSRGARSCRRA